MRKQKQHWIQRASGFGKNLAVVVAILSSLSAISGAAWSLFEFARATREKSRVAQISQLTTYASFGQFLKRYHEIEIKTDRFIRTHRETDWARFDQEQLKKYKTGSSMYYSSELEEFRDIHQFYEELATLIRFNAVDFELVFQLITFPSDFYEITKPLQNFLRDHWFELRPDPARRALKDLGFNLDELAKNYEARRDNKPVKWSQP